MAPEHCLVIIKPDAVAAGVVGAIISRYEAAGLRLVRLHMRTIDGDFADRHYAAHLGKSFYPRLREFITSGPLVAAVVEGEDAVNVVRTLHGLTDPAAAAPGTVRADFGTTVTRNAVHASDSVFSAEAELALWFGDLP